jgi:hypothetical protein
MTRFENGSLPSFLFQIAKFQIELLYLSMETLSVHPKTKKQLNAVVAVLKALDISFEKEGKNAYNPEFVAKIEKSVAEAKAGRTTTIEPSDIWNLD